MTAGSRNPLPGEQGLPSPRAAAATTTRPRGSKTRPKTRPDAPSAASPGRERPPRRAGCPAGTSFTAPASTPGCWDTRGPVPSGAAGCPGLDEHPQHSVPGVRGDVDREDHRAAAAAAASVAQRDGRCRRGSSAWRALRRTPCLLPPRISRRRSGLVGRSQSRSQGGESSRWRSESRTVNGLFGTRGKRKSLKVIIKRG
ncbi:hypothetical protein X797_000112 [Metarhizium robertsii]|uniref:Uncharacterized protein n=1 Tax=Metarhizium robertsii TaxID=568076 RepID=A0A0A1V6D9_9HYPO|nr:hypothetical protein X797_000112 [Metarhizium robertsii]